MADPKTAKNPDGVQDAPDTVEPTRIDTEGAAADALGAVDSDDAVDGVATKEADSL